MLIELHIIQNFAPSNLNRDDTGAPKDCEFGGYRRARISSQCFKRAIRETFKSQELLDKDALASRTKRLVGEIADRLSQKGRPADEARRVAEKSLNGVKLTVKDDGKTQYLLFLGESEVARIAEACDAHWEALSGAGDAAQGEQTPKKTKGKDAKKAGQEGVPEEVRKAVLDALDGGKAADLALFGRMLADLPEKNIDAASQVAQAFSTNKVSAEFDFYTAVDDLKPEDTQGADMMGTVEFNSACFYRYSNVNLEQLRKNLGGDAELTRKTLEAFLRASVEAVPTGKQNSMAARQVPSFVLAVARRAGAWSLANAFVRPVRPTAEADLVRGSTLALDAEWGRTAQVFGDGEVVEKCYVSLDDGTLKHLNGARVESFAELVGRVLKAVDGDSSEGA